MCPLPKTGVDRGEPMSEAELDTWFEGAWLEDSGDSGSMYVVIVSYMRTTVSTPADSCNRNQINK